MNEGTGDLRALSHHEPPLRAGAIGDGNFLEFLQSHTNVVFQPGYDDPRFFLQSVALGFAMMQDMERICRAARGRGPRMVSRYRWSRGRDGGVARHWANYRDESFISQFLSPHLMRQMRMFHICDDPSQTERDEGGGDPRRARLSAHPPRARPPYDVGWTDPSIEVVDVDLAGDRRSAAPRRREWHACSRRRMPSACSSTSPISGATTSCCARSTPRIRFSRSTWPTRARPCSRLELFPIAHCIIPSFQFAIELMQIA